MSVALLTDMYLYGFLVPILPFVLEHRLGLDVSLTQRMSTALLSQTALVMVVASPLIGSHADRSGAKRAWLLWGLAGALLGSLIIALATSLFALFAGRLVQSLASTGLWVVGFATLAENVPADQLGKMYGFVTVAIGVGTSGGPLVAGVLFDLGGYWVAWSSVLFVIVFDVILRCLMIEQSSLPKLTPVEQEQDPERETLLPHDPEEGPAVFLSVPVGWLKDRVGTRYPTTIGFALLVPLMWIIGIPGDERFPWACQEHIGRIIYGVAVTCIGVVICLLNGVGMMEATQAVDEIQAESPGIFGPNGGYSRAISISSISWTLGMFVGPIVSGYGVPPV
ncbi:Major facilitator superfamily domain, general substrate transporter [Penicillium griseofulvum]|uniref:Major facilitator superfamily domain, general substrate transporter n=1 Tax=Penicillium patulum TaxID=5078 RepID=A0A135LZS1_PENPA|nr:Major facilitator superfamily domain, general substrate transporter [Penicillium griseofulvum]KXG54463.1 Major facilitator superfamily domain, general substrate transporter [Penicillium griseofulvum]